VSSTPVVSAPQKLKCHFSKKVKKAFAKAWDVKLPDRFTLVLGGRISLEKHAQLIHSDGGEVVNLALGAYSYSGSLLERARVGRYCSIAVGVTFAPLLHPLSWITTSPLVYFAWFFRGRRTCRFFDNSPAPVQVGNDVWIGSDAKIMGGVTIGNGAVIGANALVTKDVPPYAIVGGVPARIIRYRFDDATIRELEELRWWDYDIGALKEPVDWSDVHQAIQAFREAIRAGKLKPFLAGDYLTVDDFRPFAKRVRFYARFSGGYRMLKLFGYWLCCSIPSRKDITK